MLDVIILAMAVVLSIGSAFMVSTTMKNYSTQNAEMKNLKKSSFALSVSWGAASKALVVAAVVIALIAIL